jgi:hypothetical protein
MRSDLNGDVEGGLFTHGEYLIEVSPECFRRSSAINIFEIEVLTNGVGCLTEKVGIPAGIIKNAPPVNYRMEYSGVGSDENPDIDPLEDAKPQPALA